MRRRIGEFLALLAMATVSLIALRASLAEAQPKPVFTGLLDFAAIYPELEPGAATRTMSAHATASATAAVIAQLDHKGIRLAGAHDYSCRWKRDLDLTQPPRACVFAESGYEIPALAVFGAEGQWLRIALGASQFGWVQAGSGYHSLPDLLATSERLTYLAAEWDGRLYGEPGTAGELVLPPEQRRRKDDPTRTDPVPYKALAHTVVAGRLWLKVEILDEVCGERDPRVLHTGWVPAQSPSGELWAWFYSRGC